MTEYACLALLVWCQFILQRIKLLVAWNMYLCYTSLLFQFCNDLICHLFCFLLILSICCFHFLDSLSTACLSLYTKKFLATSRYITYNLQFYVWSALSALYWLSHDTFLAFRWLYQFVVCSSLILSIARLSLYSKKFLTTSTDITYKLQFHIW